MNLLTSFRRLIAVVLVCSTPTALAMTLLGGADGLEGGTAAVLEAQADDSAIAAELDDVQAQMSSWVSSKGWIEGWDPDKERIIMVNVAETRIRSSDPDFLDKRAALYQELELKLKASIIETFLQRVSAKVVLDTPGNPIKKQLKAIDDQVQRIRSEGLDALDAAEEEYEAILNATNIAIVDELEGVTTADRFNAILDGIAKKLDETYSSEDISSEKRQRVQGLKQKLNESLQAVKRAEALVAERDAEAEKLLKVARQSYSKSQEVSVESFSEMPLFGAVMLKTTEAYDGRRNFAVSGAMAWSPKLQDEASQILLGTSKGMPKPAKKSFKDWIGSLDLSRMAGTRRYLAADGSTNFVGFAAVEYDPDDVDEHGELRDFAQQMAKGYAVLSLKSDVEVSRLAETKTFSVETSDGRETLSFKNMAQKFTQEVNDLSINGINSPVARKAVHKPSGRPVFVAYAYVNSDIASKSEEFRKQTYELATLINLDQAERKGREAGMRSVMEESENDPAAFAAGFADGRSDVASGVNDALAKKNGENAAKPKAIAKSKPRPVGGNASAGTFDDETDADDDF